METTKIEPALSADEWSNLTLCDGRPIVNFRVSHSWVSGSLEIPDNQKHRVAALALYGQPFGFTREDVAELRMAIGLLHWGPTKRLESLAARIEALLPPK